MWESLCEELEKSNGGTKAHTHIVIQISVSCSEITAQHAPWKMSCPRLVRPTLHTVFARVKSSICLKFTINGNIWVEFSIPFSQSSYYHLSCSWLFWVCDTKCFISALARRNCSHTSMLKNVNRDSRSHADF